MADDINKLPPLEQGIHMAMRALDNQIRKEVDRRTPAELEKKGVKKFEAYETRIERVCSLILNYIGEEGASLDSLIILSQAMTKSLALVMEDLGPEGLGKMRSEYCAVALSGLEKDIYRAEQALKDHEELN